MESNAIKIKEIRDTLGRIVFKKILNSYIEHKKGIADCTFTFYQYLYYYKLINIDGVKRFDMVNRNKTKQAIEIIYFPLPYHKDLRACIGVIFEKVFWRWPYELIHNIESPENWVRDLTPSDIREVPVYYFEEIAQLKNKIKSNI